MADKRVNERRCESRQDLSLPVWWRGPGQASPGHGWMLDVSGHGVAMLTPSDSCPAVGDRLNVSLVDPGEGPYNEISQYLLTRATVHRVEPISKSLERVALHFEDDLWHVDRSAELNGLSWMFSSNTQ